MRRARSLERRVIAHTEPPRLYRGGSSETSHRRSARNRAGGMERPLTLHAFETGSEARAGVGKWIAYYNAERPHSALGGRTPFEAHTGVETIKLAA